MKITRSSTTPWESHPPYNGIAEGFGESFFHKLIEQRPMIDTNYEYVHHPIIEKAIFHFAQAKTAETGLIVGRIGVGKSSILQYLRERVWNRMDCVVLFRDFSRKPIPLPHDYYQNHFATQRLIASQLAQECIFQTIREYNAQVDGARVSNANAFYDFIQRIRPGLLFTPIGSATPDVSGELERLQRESRDAISMNYGEFDRLRFYFLISNNNKTHVKIVLDNLDDKDIQFLALLVENVTHFQNDLMETLKDEHSKPRVVVTPFVSCRPATASALHSNIEVPGHGWFGMREFNIHKPCPITAILHNRYKYLSKQEESENSAVDDGSGGQIEIRGQTRRWVFPSRHAFFGALMQAFDDSQQGKDVLELCNRNVATAASAVGEVLRNRNFISDDDLSAVAMSAVSGAPGAANYLAHDVIRRTTVIRALAYGNPGTNTPTYPIKDTPVVNLLHAPSAEFGKTLAKPRIIDFFVNREDIDWDSGALPRESYGTVFEVVSEFFRTDRESAKRLIDTMFIEGLIDNNNAVERPSIIGEMCILEVTPRARVLFDHLNEDNVLLSCYRDQLELPVGLTWKDERMQWQDRPSWSMHYRDLFRELFWMLLHCWGTEQNECEEQLSDIGKRRRFVKVFGGSRERLITTRVHNGLCRGYERFFRDKLQAEDRNWFQHNSELLFIETSRWCDQFFGPVRNMKS